MSNLASVLGLPGSNIHVAGNYRIDKTDRMSEIGRYTRDGPWFGSEHAGPRYGNIQLSTEIVQKRETDNIPKSVKIRSCRLSLFPTLLPNCLSGAVLGQAGCHWVLAGPGWVSLGPSWPGWVSLGPSWPGWVSLGPSWARLGLPRAVLGQTGSP